MNSCEVVQTLIPSYAAKTLDESDQLSVEAHVQACPTCQRSIESLGAMLKLIEPPDITPPDALWGRLEASFEAEGERGGAVKTETLRIQQISECTICRGHLPGDKTVYCAACLSRYHGDCFADHGQCAVIGCTETRVVRPLEDATEVPTEATLPPAKRLSRGRTTTSKGTLFVAMFALTITTGLGVYSVKSLNERIDVLSRNLQAPVVAKVEKKEPARALTEAERMADVERLHAIAQERKGTAQSEAVAKLGQYVMDRGKVQYEATVMLGKLSVDTSEYLLKGFGHWDKTARQNSSDALIVQFEKYPGVLEKVTEKLRDKDPIVRKQAAITLEDMGEAAQTKLDNVLALFNDSDQDVLLQALDTAHSITTEKTGSKTFAALKRITKNENPKVRSAAIKNVKNLASFGYLVEYEEVNELLCQGLADKEESVRDMSAYSLKEFARNFPTAAKKAIPSLLKAIKDPSKNVRLWSVEALGIAGRSTPSSFLPLLQASLDKNREVSRKAGESLLKLTLAPESLFPLLLEALKDPNAGIRLFAAQLVDKNRGTKECQELLPKLVLSIEDSDEDVRNSILTTIERMGPRALSAIPGLVKSLRNPKSKNTRYSIVYALRKVGLKSPLIYKPLFEVIALGKGSASSEAYRTLALSKCPLKASLPLLIEALKDPSIHVRRCALAQIERHRLEAKDAVIPLIDMLKRPENKEITQPIINTLTSVGKTSPAAAKAMIGLLRESGSAIQWTIIGYFGNVKREALVEGEKPPVLLDPFIQALNEQLPAARSCIARVLGLIGPPAKKAIPALINTLKDEVASVSDAARHALIDIGPAVLKPIIECFKNGDEDMRTHAAQIFGELGSVSKEALPLLKATYDQSPGTSKSTEAMKAAIAKIERSLRREGK